MTIGYFVFGFILGGIIGFIIGVLLILALDV